MLTPDPLVIAGQTVVIGRIVHVAAVVAGSPRCEPAFVLRTNNHGEALLRDMRHGDEGIYQPEPRMPVALDTPHTKGRWHWPNADDHRCQGRE